MCLPICGQTDRSVCGLETAADRSELDSVGLRTAGGQKSIADETGLSVHMNFGCNKNYSLIRCCFGDVT